MTFNIRISNKNLTVSGLSLALVHKHVKINVGKWILETTHPYKHVQISEDDFLALLHSA